MAGSKRFSGDNYFNACLAVVNIGCGTRATSKHPSGVGWGFCREQPINSSGLYISHLVMPTLPSNIADGGSPMCY